MTPQELKRLSKWLHGQFHDKDNDPVYRRLCQLAHTQCQNILKGEGNPALLKLQKATLKQLHDSIVDRRRASIKVVGN